MVHTAGIALDRRQFAKGLVFGLLTARPGIAYAEQTAKLAFSTWSLHNYFPRTRSRPRFETKDWTLERAVTAIRDRYGLDRFEISSAHLASTDSPYLDRIRRFLDRQECKIIHLSDNFRGANLAHPSSDERQKILKKYKNWIRIAERIGSPSMRVNTGGPRGNQEWDFQITIDCFKELAAHGAKHNVEVVVENHFGLSADPANVVKIVKAVGHNISACPDLGLFPRHSRLEGLKLMLPYATHICSTKYHDFAADGRHPDFDFAECLRTLRHGGFKGWASLEYQGMNEPFGHIEQALKLAREFL